MYDESSTQSFPVFLHAFDAVEFFLVFCEATDYVRSEFTSSVSLSRQSGREPREVEDSLRRYFYHRDSLSSNSSFHFVID